MIVGLKKSNNPWGLDDGECETMLNSYFRENRSDTSKTIKPDEFSHRADTSDYKIQLIVATALTPDKLQQLHYQGD